MRALLRRTVVVPAVAVVLAVGGCQYTGPVGGPGTVTVTTPLTIPPAPPGTPPPPPPGVGTRAAARPADGEYAGTARALSNPGQQCSNTIKVTQWIVRGDQVSYRGFQGTISPDGALKMQFKDAYIIGSFRGSHFDGRFWRPQPACTYAITVDPV